MVKTVRLPKPAPDLLLLHIELNVDHSEDLAPIRGA